MTNVAFVNEGWFFYDCLRLNFTKRACEDTKQEEAFSPFYSILSEGGCA